MSLDIVNLIENNPITKFSSDNYQNKLVNKIKQEFTDTQQQLFLSSFYCYLNYDQKKDFVVDLDNVWKWIGFARKDQAKRLLTKYFKEDVDYTMSASIEVVAKDDTGNRGGHNKEQIMLNIKTFKKFCMKVRTDKADEIHDYYMNLEDIIQDTLKEESENLKSQLLLKDKEIYNTKEKTLIEQNPVNTLCVYYGMIDNKSENGESLVKFGRTNNLKRRVKEHKKTFDDFRLIQVYKVSNHIEIENCIKSDSKLKTSRRVIDICDKKYNELLVYVDDIEDEIKRVITENEYNIENYNIVKQLNNELKIENENLRLENKQIKYKNNQTKIENKSLNDIYNCRNMNSMKNIVIMNKELKNAICINFFINFIVYHIKLKKGFLDFVVETTLHDLYEEYKKYRLSNKYTEPLHDEQYEKNILTRSMNHIPGIENKRYRGGESYKNIHIGTVVEWMNENITIPKQYRHTFKIKEKSCYNYLKHENKELEHVYNFFIYFIEKNKTKNDTTLNILYTEITENYRNFYLISGYHKKIYMRKIDKILNNFSFIKSTYNGRRVMSVNLEKYYEWRKTFIS